jgi:hypothetical protein
LLALLVVFGGWRRLRPAAAFGLLAACGCLLGAGALLVQAPASGVEWTLTLVALGILTPLHARLMFGRPGPRG